MSNIKTTRDSELVRNTRESEKRDHHMIPTYNMGHISALKLRPGVARDGYEYYWATREIAGKVTYEVETLCSQGWSIVPNDRCPGYNPDPLNRHPYASQYFCYMDVILLERPAIYGEKQRESESRYTNNRLSASRTTYGPLGPMNLEIRNDYGGAMNPVSRVTSF